MTTETLLLVGGLGVGAYLLLKPKAPAAVAPRASTPPASQDQTGAIVTSAIGALPAVISGISDFLDT